MKGQPYKRKKVRKNRFQAAEDRRRYMAEQLAGTGAFVFQNNTKGDLILRKKANNGAKMIPPGGQWEGDDFFMEYVKNHEAILIRTIVEEKEMDEKLILDQPNLVTSGGTMEQVKVKAPAKLDEEEDTEATLKDILINEDPLDGVEIILD